MFTQNPMQAFRSVFVALLIISVFPRWCAAEESKVDASVRTAAETQSMVSVAISLRDKPPSKQISDAVKAEFYPNIKAKATEIRDRIRPFTRRNRALPPNVKAEVRVMHESLDRQTHQMRQEIGRRLKNRVAASQQRVCTAIENAEGTVYAQIALGNLIGARLSDSAVTQIAALDEVERIGLATVPVPDLAGSAQIIYAPRSWDAGFHGGVYDVGIIESGGVEDEHPHLRSKAAGKLIESHPDDDEAIANPKIIDHGTAVAGIVAMTAYTDPTDTEVEHKGIAYGLDKILDATFSGSAVAAMEWAMTNTSDDAEVITLPYSWGNRVTEDYRMDKGDSDYDARLGGKFDALIDSNDALIIKSAGNSGKGHDQYSLGWGSGSYNAIVVGASTASGDNEPRAKNEVQLTSSRGPTPAGRKKPDVVAPGFEVTTTDRGGGFDLFSGTSAAVPHVAGAILLFADHGLWHPMMQKALLINTAEDRGDAGWDKDWGWGYIDLYAALEQYDYTISGSIDGGAEKWYRGTMNDCQTVTLVWHKHSGQPLSNLDMFLYDAGTNGFIGVSNSIRDNVEQVKIPSGDNRAVYLKIVHRDSEGETFGLAVPSEFTSIDRPSFTQ